MAQWPSAPICVRLIPVNRTRNARCQSAVMNMTHYMELLASSQPWNLIAFMAIPVLLAETVAVTELFVLLKRPQHGPVVALNRTASIAGGLYFAGVFVYLMFNAVVPITSAGEWRGPADMIAVGF